MYDCVVNIVDASAAHYAPDTCTVLYLGNRRGVFGRIIDLRAGCTNETMHCLAR